MESQFPSNAHGQKRPAKQTEPAVKPAKVVERITTSKVTVRKEPVTKKLRRFFSPSDLRDVFDSVFTEVVIPRTKDAISDTISTAVERSLFGDDYRSRGRGRGSMGRGGYTSYSSMSGRNRDRDRDEPASRREDPRALSRRARANFDFNEIVIPSRVEAQEVLVRLQDIINEYEVVSVRDLYSMVGEDSSFTDEKWGWTDLRGSAVHGIREGYLLDLPRPEPID